MSTYNANNLNLFKKFNTPNCIVQIIYSLLDNDTQYNFIIQYGLQFFDHSKKIINNLKVILKKSNNYLDPINEISSEICIKTKKLMYVLQDPSFESNLRILKAITYHKNLDNYKKLDKIIMQYIIFKLYNPFLNSQKIKDCNSFDLINLNSLQWLIKHENYNKNVQLSELPLIKTNTYFPSTIKHKTIKLKYKDINNKFNLNCIPFHQIFLNENWVIAGGSSSACIFNYLCDNQNIKFNDIDLFWFDNLNINTNFELKVINLHKKFKEQNIYFICFSKREQYYNIQRSRIKKMYCI